MKKARKPRLTKAMVSKLRTLTNYAEANADELLSSNDTDQRKRANEVLEAIGWINGLCRWHDLTRLTKPTAAQLADAKGGGV